MFYINYDLARQLTDERRALAQSLHLRARANKPVPPPSEPTEADVIELAFGTHCEPEQIGA